MPPLKDVTLLFNILFCYAEIIETTQIDNELRDSRKKNMLQYLDSVSIFHIANHFLHLFCTRSHVTREASSSIASRTWTNFNMRPVCSCSHILESMLILKLRNAENALPIGSLVDMYDATTTSIITER